MGLGKLAAYIVVGLGLQFVASLAPFREQQHPREIRWDVIGILATLLFFVLYGLTIGGPVAAWVANIDFVSQWHDVVRNGPYWPLVAFNFVLADFINYWAHRLLHSRWFWHTHAWHHAPKHLWWMSGLRGSPVHVLLNILPYTAAYLMCPTTAGGIVGMGVVLLGIANQHWQHSNIRLPYSHQIEWLLVTPRFHFVHHSAAPKFTNSNYGFLTTIWDRMFGTFVDPDTVPLDEPIGLDYENSNTRLLIGLPPDANR